MNGAKKGFEPTSQSNARLIRGVSHPGSVEANMASVRQRLLRQLPIQAQGKRGANAEGH
jgi:hypothetical protein